MTTLVFRNGMKKAAAVEDGPSLEQQFGIMTNAQIAENFPKLNNMKLAFQLIEKKDDSEDAFGAAVYLVGRNVIYIPSIYKNGEFKTGDMMLLAATQQFLPLSDPWLAWLQDKDLQQPAEELPVDYADASLRDTAVTVKQIADPILKTASHKASIAHLRAALHMDPDLTRMSKAASVLDAAVSMGKTTAGRLLDQLVDNPDVLNSALRFYDGDAIDAFAKKASDLNEEKDPVQLIMPFTKEASELSPEDNEILKRDGYLIKYAAENLPTVIKVDHIKPIFTTIHAAGMYQLATIDGDLKPGLVLRQECLESQADYERKEDDVYARCGDRTYGSPGMNARYNTSKWCAILSKDAELPCDLPANAIALANPNDNAFKPEMLKGYGKALTKENAPVIRWSDYILCPDGVAYFDCKRCAANGDGWTNDDQTWRMTISEYPTQKSPIIASNYVILPQGSRILQKPRNTSEDGPVDMVDSDKAIKEDVRYTRARTFATQDNIDRVLKEYTKKHYTKFKMTSNGSEITVNDEITPMSVKEASVRVVKEFGVDPSVVRTMMKEVYKGIPGRPHSETYYIEKKAADQDDISWEKANVPNSEFTNVGDRISTVSMPTEITDPAQLQKAMTIAAEQGIKEVFDVTTLKLIIRDGDFLSDIQKSIPLFMKCLDGLCRKLLLLYWRTEDFEEQYGLIKLKALEASIKNTLDSLSELTIFFKVRSIDGYGAFNNNGGDLMQGHDMM